MQRIVFLIYHGMGHFNACLKPAKTLRSQYEVIFSGHIYFEKYVEEQGFPFYALKSVPFGLGFEPWMNKIEKKKNIWWHSLKDRWRDRLYHDRKNELIKMLEETEPNYILIDSWQSTDFIVLYQHLKSRSIKVAFIQTMVSSVIERGLPPLNSLAQPGNRSEIENAHQHYYNQQFRKKLIGKLKFFGRDNDTLIKTKIRENHIPEKYLSNQLSLFSPGFSRVDEFILSPLEFDFPSAGAPHQHYIGFMTDNSRIEVTDTAYLKLDRAIRLKLKETEAALIYCSFGTVSYEDMRSVREFLKKLINIAKEQNCVLIISSNAIDQASTNDLPENVYVFKVVPQLQVLTLASVMITHGGLNSIKEAIYAEVPMLVYPVDFNTDQPGNAARVTYHKLGLHGDLARDSQYAIEEKLTALITEPEFVNNVRAMKTVDRDYSPDRFVEALKEIRSLE